MDLIASLTTTIVIARIFFPQSALSFSSRSHETSKENCFQSKSLSEKHCQIYSALLPTNVDRRPQLQRGLMNFQLQKFQLIYITNHWSLEKQLILIPSNLLRSSRNKMNCLPRDQCLILTSFPGQTTEVCIMYNN